MREQQPSSNQSGADCDTAVNSNLRRRIRIFTVAEDGSLIVFGIFIFTLMLAIGGLSLDLMRYETARITLQSTADRAVLAAASLSQSLDPETVVVDYFAKAGLSGALDSIVVTDALGNRRVDVTASVAVPLHFGNFSAFGGPDDENDTLMASAASSAMEAIGNVEISMVLDVSGSMGSFNRLTNLKTAATNFVDTVYGAAEAGTVSTSIVPYAEQVTVGSTLLSQYDRGDSAHTNSFCLNFDAADFSSTGISPTTAQEQTLHFNHTSSSSTSWSPDDPLSDTPCRTTASRRILPWSDDEIELKAHIDALTSGGWTSTDLGMKWGTALLDPGTESVLSALITSGDVDAGLSGRPEPFDDGQTMKVIVVMTDGDNTYQHYMDDPYRLGDSAVYFWEDENGDDFYSVWGGDGEPVFDPEPECTRWSSRNGSCRSWSTPEDWYRVNSGQFDETPYGGAGSTRLTWSELWAKIPVRYFTDQILADMGASSTDRNAIKNAIEQMNGSTKDTQMAANCSAAKNEGVTIFSVALETSDAAAGQLEACASSPAHFYRVTGTEIDFAFQSIASQINMLRLVY